MELPDCPPRLEARPGLTRGEYDSGEALAVHAALALLLAEVLKDILPAGVLSIIPGDGPLGAELCQHPTVRKISFTGSVATGEKIMGYATEDLKRLTLELGGNDPAIVLDDVDPTTLVEKLF